MEQNVAAGGLMALMGGIGLVFLLLMMVPAVFYLLTLQKAFTRCSPENRAMQPGMVWLMLIPLFGLIWHFFVVLNLAKSLGAEFKKRNLAEEPEPGKTLGLVLCILPLCSIIPIVNMITGLATLVVWIIYWVKIAGFSGKLAAPAA